MVRSVKRRQHDTVGEFPSGQRLWRVFAVLLVAELHIDLENGTVALAQTVTQHYALGFVSETLPEGITLETSGMVSIKPHHARKGVSPSHTLWR